MDATEDQEEIEKGLCWANSPPPPIPGMYYIEPQIKHDFSSFDDSLEGVIPKEIHTDLLEALEVDFMKIVMEHDSNTGGLKKESWSGRLDQISDQSFGIQEKRSEVLEREKVNRNMKELFDYQKYIQESFEDVSSITHPINANIKVEASFDLFPESNIENILIQSDCMELFPNTRIEVEEDGFSRLFNKARMPDGSVFACFPQRINDFIVFSVRDGRAYYSEIPTLYRLQEYKSQKKPKEDKSK